MIERSTEKKIEILIALKTGASKYVRQILINMKRKAN